MNELKPKPKRKLWIYAGVITVIIIVVSVIAYRKKNKLEITYREIQVMRNTIDVTILGTGTVQPENRLEIKPPVAGRVEEVLVKEGQIVHKGQVLAWMSSTERAALLDAARARGKEELKKWEENYRPTPIIAPINGTVILRNVESGQTFTNIDSVFVMSDRLTVKAQVDETDIAEIKLGENAKIVLDAYPNESIPGRVDQIAYEAKTVNNVTTYEVDVLPKKTPDFMRSGMTVNVTFFITSKENILTVPNDALRVKDSAYSILVQSPEDKSPVEKPIKTGITDGKQTEIIEGLSQGDTILAAEIKTSQRKSQSSNPFAPYGGVRRGGGGGGR